MFEEIVGYIRKLYETDEFIPLHEPRFIGDEKVLVADCIDSTFVSSVGKYVNQFEDSIKEATGAKYAIATTNGTSALHVSLYLCGVDHESEVITQAVSFVATANAISYTGARPIFLDSDRDNLGLSPESLQRFLEEECYFDGETVINKKTKRHIKACIAMHVFGHPVRINEISQICRKYKIVFIEDAAESLGSKYQNQHTGNFGLIGILSFNGNKIITTGGGGMIITNDEAIARRAKHVTTTSKQAHSWEFFHDQLGFNYRLPNLNAALGVAQMRNLNYFLADKRGLAASYQSFFDKIGIEYLVEPKNAESNYWLNAIRLKNKKERDDFLKYTNEKGVMTRPLWTLLSDLPMYKEDQRDNLENACWHYNTIVNIPSSVRILRGKI